MGNIENFPNAIQYNRRKEQTTDSDSAKLESSDPYAEDDVQSDEQLERLVKNTFQWSPFLKDVALDVIASGGTVTITGVTPYRSLGRMAGTLAWTIPGVHGVVNDIRIIAVPDEEPPPYEERGDGSGEFGRAHFPDSAL